MYTDAQIVAMMQGSREEQDKALEDFFSNPGRRNAVLTTITGMGGTEHDAEDAFSKGTMIFWRHLRDGNFRGGSTLHTYFVGICKGCWLDGRKSSHFKRTTLSDDLPALDQERRERQDSPEAALLAKERDEKLREILGLLGERCKKIILMKYQGYSGEEIKEQLDMSGEKNVRKIKYRCMEKLRDLIKKEPRLYAILKSMINGKG